VTEPKGSMGVTTELEFPITVVVPIRFCSSRDAAAFIQRALINALQDMGHVVDPVISYKAQDGRTVRTTDILT